ncbi:hypothetical protein PoB_003574200 [Plakobranchus ocellatus]|uniref:Uncharacterized protein n=1 Tax=Plakobranchus ocellatus TaxID=259542 RepID=A0AAV4AQM4_9GAST|nr:hypothetical protein PoB_003574200 [Plakobranchus ocellatus]
MTSQHRSRSSNPKWKKFKLHKSLIRLFGFYMPHQLGVPHGFVQWWHSGSERTAFPHQACLWPLHATSWPAPCQARCESRRDWRWLASSMIYPFTNWNERSCSIAEKGEKTNFTKQQLQFRRGDIALGTVPDPTKGSNPLGRRKTIMTAKDLPMRSKGRRLVIQEETETNRPRPARWATVATLVTGKGLEES